MRIDQLFPSQPPDWEAHERQERAHAAALDKTGFWGKQGAGCLFLARSTGKLLIAHRSGAVEQPHTWGTWGGAIDDGEDPVAAVKREAHEEAGYTGPVQVVPLYVFQSGSFRYSNFLLIVPEEFAPQMNWETQDYAWVRFSDWPKPLHFGLQALLADAASVATIKAAIQATPAA